MPTVTFKGKTWEVDEDGFLQDPEKWDKDFAAYVKESEGISELTDEHWKVIDYLQDYYKKNGIAPHGPHHDQGNRLQTEKNLRVVPQWTG